MSEVTKLKEEIIRDIGKRQGIDLMGFFKTEPLVECLPFLKKRIDDGFQTGFELGVPEERINYQHTFKEARSGIVIGINYYQAPKEPKDEKLRGKIAGVAWGTDYHVVLKEKMKSLMEEVKLFYQTKKTFNYEVYTDNSPLIDRFTAYDGGLGFFGKNNCLINETLGSYFFIGQILLNEEIEFKEPKKQKIGCKECNLCIKACPNKALGEGYSLDPNHCISFLTQKKDLTEEEEKRIKGYIYGCDICQKVCPYNQGLEVTKEEGFYVSGDEAFPVIEDLITMSNQGFKDRFGKTAAFWRGKKNLIRNATILQK